jgi:hypothetical protein
MNKMVAKKMQKTVALVLVGVYKSAPGGQTGSMPAQVLPAPATKKQG